MILYSEKDGENLSEYTVFILDTIGLLTKTYAYADATYVGGGFKTGLHNILEPATFGIPVIIGPVYNKFKEALDLVNLGGCISVGNQSAFSSTFNKLKNDEKNNGFVEAVPSKINKDKIPIFNLGPDNDWKKIVDKDQQIKLTDIFKEDLIEIGYE